MQTSEQVLRRIDDLIKFGTETILATRRGDGYGNDYIDGALFAGWRTQVLNALRSILGADHTYAREFEGRESSLVYDTEAGLAILRALRDDIRNGYLVSITNLVSSEVFSDFLQMAQHLLDNQYKDPAASLCGAVFGKWPSPYSPKNGVKLTGSDDLSSLRDRCAQTGIFNKLVRQQIVAWTTLRNHADHGEFDQYSPQQVGTMINDVGSFLAMHLS